MTLLTCILRGKYKHSTRLAIIYALSFRQFVLININSPSQKPIEEHNILRVVADLTLSVFYFTLTVQVIFELQKEQGFFTRRGRSLTISPFMTTMTFSIRSLSDASNKTASFIFIVFVKAHCISFRFYSNNIDTIMVILDAAQHWYFNFVSPWPYNQGFHNEEDHQPVCYYPNAPSAVCNSSTCAYLSSLNSPS